MQLSKSCNASESGGLRVSLRSLAAPTQVACNDIRHGLNPGRYGINCPAAAGQCSSPNKSQSNRPGQDNLTGAALIECREDLHVQAEEFCLVLQQGEGVAHHGAGLVQQVQVKDTIAHIYHVFLSADEVLADAVGKLLLEIAGL